jgi:hypothetical protein
MMAVRRTKGRSRKEFVVAGVSHKSATPAFAKRYFQDGDGQIIFPVASLSGQTTTGSPFCIWWV